MSFITVDEISYTYPVPEEFSEDIQEAKKEVPAKPALTKVSMEIEEGQFVCILGRNGSGKSTLARMFNALLIPDEGKVWVDGKATSEEDHVWDIRAMVGMVFQNPDNQIIGSVVDEDVAFGLENLGVPPEEIRKRVGEVLEQVGMAGYAKHSPNQLSGGQKQRVAVAGILAMEPRCIVLDEATAMLDPKGREEVMRMAASLNKEKGITIIAITHYMDEAVHADKIFVMDEGRIVMKGTPKEIFSKEKEIEALGLKLPQASKLAVLLREKGMDIPGGVLTADDLTAAVKRE